MLPAFRKSAQNTTKPPTAGLNRQAQFVDTATQLARDWWNSGRRPEELFLLKSRDRVLHLFTSRALALDYGRVRQVAEDLQPLAIANIANQAELSTERGMTSFVLDRCPRCSSANFVSIELLRSPEQLGQFWAFTLILQRERMRHFASSAFRSLLEKRTDKILPELKQLRDHVNAGCAAVHYALALLHTLEPEDRTKGLLAESKQRLAELGHQDLVDQMPSGAEALILGFELVGHMAQGNFELMEPAGKGAAARAGRL